MIAGVYLGVALAMGTIQTQALKPPHSMVVEHEEIHAQLLAATQVGGRTGNAAKQLVAVLHPHFEREQQIALPPLGVLESLAAGKGHPMMSEAVRLSRQLKKELPKMLEEHKSIRKATQNLIQVAQQEKRAAVVDFGHRLAAHALFEEQVTYPAAILVATTAAKK